MACVCDAPLEVGAEAVTLDPQIISVLPHYLDTSVVEIVDVGHRAHALIEVKR